MTVTIYRELEQGSEEWLQARCGLLTASTIGRLITPTLKVADNEGSRGLALTLAAERITGVPEHVPPTLDMQRGHDDEPFARLAYAEHYAPVEEVGFITLEQNGYKLGYSPDGLVDSAGVVEIKSRKAPIQVKTILDGSVPTANRMQLQCGLFVSGREWADYISYRDGLPLFVTRVYPDPNAFAVIDEVARKFEADVAAVIERYEAAAAGFPFIERRPELEDIRI